MAESLSWRLPFAILTALPFSYVLMTLFLLPASPRWLIIHGRELEAEKTWDLLGVKHEDRRSLENEIQNHGAVNNNGPTTANELPQRLAGRERHASFLDLLSHDVRKRTILAVFIMGFLQLCGIDAVLYVSVIDISERAPTAILANAKQHAPLLFQQAGLQSAKLPSWHREYLLSSLSPPVYQRCSSPTSGVGGQAPFSEASGSPSSCCPLVDSTPAASSMQAAALLAGSSLSAYISLLRAPSHYMGHQHQGICPGDPASANTRPSDQSRGWRELAMQLLRGLYLSDPAGQECVWCLFFIRRLYGFGHHCELLVHGGGEGQVPR